MRSDEQRCLASGMDGYVTKPINASELNALREFYAKERDCARARDA